MIPHFLELSELERSVLQAHYSSLASSANDFAIKFCKRISKSGKFVNEIKNCSDSRMVNAIASRYEKIISPSVKWNDLGKLSEMHAKFGISEEDLLDIYDNMYYLEMEKSINALDISEEDKVTLKASVQKRIAAEIFAHINGYEREQKRKLAEREAFYRALSDISRIFGTELHHSLSKLLKSAASTLVKDIGLKLVWIGYVKPKEKYVKIIAVAGEASGYTKGLKISLDPSIPEGKGPSAMSLITGEPFVINDFNDAIFTPWRARAQKYGLGASANISFTTSDEKIWNISLYNGTGKKFSQQIEDLLGALSSTMNIFIEKKLRDLALEKIRELQIGVSKAQKELLKSPSIEVMYNLMVEIISTHTQSTNVVFISVPDGNCLKIVAANERNADSLMKMLKISTDPNHPQGYFTATKAFSEKRPIIMNVERDENYKRLGIKYPELSVRSIGSWPIFQEGKGEPIAILTVGSRDGDFFSKDIRRLMEQLVSSIQIALNQYIIRKKMEWMSLHDALTELPNRAYFEQSANDAMRRAKREKRKIAIGFMDIDGFKEWNDTFGHTAGDELLKEMGHVLRSIIRGGDGVGRMGGDEFLFHIAIDNVSELENVEKRITRAISTLRRGEMKVYGSIGWAIFPDDGEDLKVLIAKADMNMYVQKKVNK